MRLFLELSYGGGGVSRCGTPVACALQPPASPERTPEGRLTKPAKLRLSQLLKQLPKTDCASEEGCATCLQLLQTIRAEGFIRDASPNVQNTAMRLCVSRLHEVEQLFAELSDMNVMSEASYAGLIQAQVQHGELERAAALLDAMLVDPRVPKPRLRTCAPLLRSLFERNEVATSTELWARLSRREIEFTASEYGARMRMHGRSGDARALYQCLGDFFERYPVPDIDLIDAITMSVHDCAVAASSAAVAVSRVRLEPGATCTSCGTTLKLLSLTAAERESVREEVLERAAERSAAGFKRLLEYREWLRVRPPFDYVLDGPNIAYFNQNWEDGAFSFQQIQDIIDAIQDDSPDARVLLLLPEKYLKAEIPNHTTNKQRKTKLKDSDWGLIGSWRESGLLYECAHELYDDWYWMYASVAETQAPEPDSRELESAGVTRVVTNDAMRDHWDQLLPPIAFQRWRQAQILPFGCHNSTYAEQLAAGMDSEAAKEARMSAMPVASMEAPAADANKPTVDSSFAEAMDRTEGRPRGEEEAEGRPRGEEEAEGRPSGEEEGHSGLARMREAGLEGPLRTWVAAIPRLSIEAQAEATSWHVPVPDTNPQEWLCIQLPHDAIDSEG